MRPNSDRAALLTALQVKMEQEGQTASQARELFEIALNQGIIERHEIERDHPDFINNLVKKVTSDGSKDTASNNTKAIEQTTDAEKPKDE